MYFFIVILLISLFIKLDDKMALCKSHHNSTNIDWFTLIFCIQDMIIRCICLFIEFILSIVNLPWPFI